MTPHVLIAEDDEDISRLLEAKLRSAGFEVTLFEDGEACWTYLERLDSVDDAPPDLLILDVMMPKLDGFRILGRINESETLRDLPVLMLTARSRETDVVRGLELGATDYVAKPFSVSELAARADKLIGRP
ncbi:response regulator transcription factor [Halalkalicoccus ordinarius]|uniref:response regulator transcription factor n=1 Tax=Halalkalicoccus ordinarius TaxID=3116651 RepID=UPI00300F1281